MLTARLVATKPRVKPLLLLSLALGLIQNGQAALIVNGSFEAATNAATLSAISLSSGSTNIPGWTTTNAELTWDGPNFGIPLTAAQGSDFLDLTGVHDASPYGAVFQTISTTVGLFYDVSFEVGSDKYYDSYYTSTFTVPAVTVSLNGVAVFSANNNFPNATNYWQTWSFSFMALNTNTTLTFTGVAGGRVGYIGLDNVIVTLGGPPLVIALDQAAVAYGQAHIPFTVTSGTASSFELLQSAQLVGPWTTNASATLTTNSPGRDYTFVAPTSGAVEFYRVQSP